MSNVEKDKSIQLCRAVMAHACTSHESSSMNVEELNEMLSKLFSTDTIKRARESFYK